LNRKEASFLICGDFIQGKIADIIDRGLFLEVSVNSGKLIFRSTLSKRDLFSLNLSEKKDVYIEIRSSNIHAF